MSFIGPYKNPLELEKVIESGPYTLLDSGSIITIPNEETKLNITFHTIVLNFIFRFETSATPTSPHERIEQKDKNTLEITFFDYHRNSLGVYTTAPIHLGQIAKRELLLLYRIIPLQNADSYHIHYSFYISK